MQVVMIDDEPAMLLIMEQMLAQLQGVKVAGSFLDADSAFTYVEREHVDMAFIDITLKDDDGLVLAKRMRQVLPDLDIVFVTSHKAFALEAYQTYPLDYIVKPITLSRLEQTVARSIRRSAANNHQQHNRLHIQLLGALEVSSNQEGAIRWISQKSQELCACLLLQEGRSISKSRLIEEVFAHMPLKNAETYLYTAVYQLRKALAALGFASIVQSGHEQYRLDLAPIDADFLVFEQKLRQIGTIDEANIAAAIELERTYTGDLLGEMSYVWAMPARERLGNLYEQFAKRLIRWLLDHRRGEEAALIAKRLVLRNELDEEANGLLLEAYAVKQDRAALQNHFVQFSALLHHELGVAPAEKIVHLFERIR